MTIRTLLTATTAVVALLALPAPAARAVMTVDDAVRLALQKNSRIVSSQAGVLDARSGAYSAWSGVLPRVTGSVSRFNTWTDAEVGRRLVGGGFTQEFTSDFEAHGTNPTISGSWNLFNLSSISALRSARRSQGAAKQSLQSARNEVAFDTRRQFYEVVKSIQLSQVADSALLLARDDERRVRALFEVGSVSRNDVLRAQVRTAQAELDSLTRAQAIIAQRILLATAVGTDEEQLGEVDTTLTVEPRTYVLEDLVREAGAQRPDLRAAELELSAARTGLNSARLAYLPYVTGSGSVTYNPTSRSTFTVDDVVSSSKSESDREMSAQIALNMDLFNGLSTQAGIASAKARAMRAQDTRDVLTRNLRGEVRQSLLAYQAAVAGETVARRALDSATEGLKLAREKYNVGSATILDLIDAQVNLQRAAADLVSARAAIRVAEADLERVRGRAE